MPQTISLEEGDIHTTRNTLDTGDQVSLGPPAQATLKAIYGLADAVQLAFAVVDTDDTADAFLKEIDSDVSAVASPADAATTVIIRTQSTLVYLFWNGRISERLCLRTPPLELRLLLAPSHRDVFGELEILGRESDLCDDVEAPAHKHHLGVTSSDHQQLLVWRPTRSGNGRRESAYNFDMGFAWDGNAFLVFSDGDNITASHDDTCRQRIAEIVHTPDGVWRAILAWARSLPGRNALGLSGSQSTFRSLVPAKKNAVRAGGSYSCAGEA